MSQDDLTESAIELLQQLGLQQYEARCFMALTQLDQGTAKDIHEISEVPRTRVYDAIRVLESQGLVEIHHSSPQMYRSVGIEQATQILRKRYENRIDTLQTYLENTKPRKVRSDDERVQEVWSMVGHDSIGARTLDLVDEATSEVALLVVDEDLLSAELFAGLHEATERGVNVLVGGLEDGLVSRLRSELPDVQVFETGIDWLVGPEKGEEVAISRILLIDRKTLLIGSFYPDSGDGEPVEQAVFARGLENGVVVLIRRMLASGLLPADD